MTKSMVTLRDILKLEAARGYQNDAVMGGLENYAQQWNLDAVSYVRDRSSAEKVAMVTQLLDDYAMLPLGARRSTIRYLHEALDALEGSASIGRASANQPPKGRRTSPGSSKSQVPRTKAPTLGLDAPVDTLTGVGPSTAKLMARLGLRTVGDLLWHLPYRYQDYSDLRKIADLQVGDEVTIRATLWGMRSRRTRNNRKLTTAILIDGSGRINATFWNPYIDKMLQPQRRYFFSGKVGSFEAERLLESPDFEPDSDDPTHTARIVPIYPLTEGLSARVLRKHIRTVVETWTPTLPDPLPRKLIERLQFPPYGDALAQVHFPDDALSLQRARQRLAFNELLTIQLGVLGQHRAWQNKAARPLHLTTALQSQLWQVLPFTLTAAQQRALTDIYDDVRRPHPMTRLLQGDVGSGKTILAVSAMWLAVCNGYQAALMAPTEVLAEQHYRGLTKIFADFVHPLSARPVRLDLLTGRMSAQSRARQLAALSRGETDLLVGTHALFQEQVQFQSLALIVVDEQHRFGVNQRSALRDKGATLNTADGIWANHTPHTLVMSATPIPRTLALTIFGDMDVSVIDEMPPGRQPIKTYWVKPDARKRIHRFVADQISSGRQAFIIYPLVDESDRLDDVKAAVAEHEYLQSRVFPRLSVGLLHGRLSSLQKDEIMRAFAGGEIDILVSTAVVEVGIDVPNASVIVIENAERFGLAQLHQFRGRVGRGEHQSFCILISEPNSDDGIARMRAMEQTLDGFALAEIDLQMRGPGEFFGTRQSGIPDLRLARLSDTRLLELARHEANGILDSDPDLGLPEHQSLAQHVSKFWSQEIDLS